VGGVVVPVNTRYRETELRHILADSGARIVVTDPGGREEVQKVLGETPAVERVLEASGSDWWSGIASGGVRREPIELTGDDLAVIGYTSGTTGRSKGALMTHGNFCSNSIAVTSSWGWTANDHLLLVLPLFHTHGLAVGLHGTMIQGSTITLHRSFVAADVLSELHSGRISMFFGVPTMYGRLLAEARQRPERPTGVRLLVSGSAPLSPQVLEEVQEEFGLRILERYGMTETVMNLGNPLEGERKAGSVGLPFPGIEVRIADPSDSSGVETGDVGEVQLRGPNICRGYWQAPEATAEVWTTDGWFRTGDLGYRDPDGYVFLTGRARELIISGGFNIYPREVEEVLEAHAGVAEAAVFGLSDPDLGEKVVAAVVSTGTDPIDVPSLQEFCRARLASFKKPREVYIVPALPRNALGKVQKHVLKEQLADGSAG
jgi:malonyl-CoA/methylmalonyl-CoA synthetase